MARSGGGGSYGQHKGPRRKVTEDDPAWNWRTMGDRNAGPKIRKKYPSGSLYEAWRKRPSRYKPR